MGRKKRNRDNEDKESKPYCTYCDKMFQDDKVLETHQKAKHFKCSLCDKKANNAGGLVVHMFNSHKQNITTYVYFLFVYFVLVADRISIPNSKPGRETISAEILNNIIDVEGGEYKRQKTEDDFPKSALHTYGPPSFMPPIGFPGAPFGAPFRGGPPPFRGGPMGPMGVPRGGTMGPQGPVPILGQAPVRPIGGPMGGPQGPMGGQGPMKMEPNGSQESQGPMGPTQGPVGPMGGPQGPMGGPQGPMSGPQGPMGGPMGARGGPMGPMGLQGPMVIRGGPMGAPMGGPMGPMGVPLLRGGPMSGPQGPMGPYGQRPGPLFPINSQGQEQSQPQSQPQSQHAVLENEGNQKFHLIFDEIDISMEEKRAQEQRYAYNKFER